MLSRTLPRRHFDMKRAAPPPGAAPPLLPLRATVRAALGSTRFDLDRAIPPPGHRRSRRDLNPISRAAEPAKAVGPGVSFGVLPPRHMDTLRARRGCGRTRISNRRETADLTRGSGIPGAAAKRRRRFPARAEDKEVVSPAGFEPATP